MNRRIGYIVCLAFAAIYANSAEVLASCEETEIVNAPAKGVKVRKEPSVYDEPIFKVYEGQKYQVSRIEHEGQLVSLDNKNCSHSWVELKLRQRVIGWVPSFYTSCGIQVASCPQTNTSIPDPEISANTIFESHECQTAKIIGVEDSSLNLRPDPSNAGKSLGKIYNNQEFTVLGRFKHGERVSNDEKCSKTWLKLGDEKRNRVYGWVPAIHTNCKIEWENCNDSISPIVDSPEQKNNDSLIEKNTLYTGQCPNIRIKNTGGDRINVRSRPALVGRIIGKVREGEEYIVLDANHNAAAYQDLGICSSTWLNIELSGGETGWITSVYTDCKSAQNACDANQNSNIVDLDPISVIPDVDIPFDPNQDKVVAPYNPDLKCPQISIVNSGGDSINVRSQPNLQGSVVGRVYETEQYNVMEVNRGGGQVQDGSLCSETWVKLSIPNGTDGWMTSIYANCPELHEKCKDDPPTPFDPIDDISISPISGAGGCRTSRPHVWPVPNNRSVGQRFGVYSSYMDCGTHSGIDISDSTHNPILAAGSGRVVWVGHMWLNRPGTGRGPNAVIIDHGGGTYSTYSHNQTTIVKPGDCVSQGEKIGTIGSLGYSSGPHLHFEVLEGAAFTGVWDRPFNNVCSKYRDPMDYL